MPLKGDIGDIYIYIDLYIYIYIHIYICVYICLYSSLQRKLLKGNLRLPLREDMGFYRDILGLGFPKIKAAIFNLGVSIIWIIVFEDVYWGPPILEDYQLEQVNC